MVKAISIPYHQVIIFDGTIAGVSKIESLKLYYSYHYLNMKKSFCVFRTNY